MEERAAKLECKDDDDRCLEWAASGQCQSNRSYMVSSCFHLAAICERQVYGQLISDTSGAGGRCCNRSDGRLPESLRRVHLVPAR